MTYCSTNHDKMNIRDNVGGVKKKGSNDRNIKNIDF